ITTICLLFIFAAGTVYAQQTRQYSFLHYTTRDGLLSNRVQSIAQDKEGYLWLGTINGLQRFDGHRFISFRYDATNPYSIPDNEIWQIYIDKKQNLWMILSNGMVGKFDTKKFQFREAYVKVQNQRVKTAFKHFYEDSKGNLMVIYPGLETVTYNESTNTFSSADNIIKVPPGWRLGYVYEDPRTNKYWMTSDSGIAVYNPRTQQLSYRNHNDGNEPVITEYGNKRQTFLPYVDKRNRFWFQTWVLGEPPSFFCYDLQTQQPVVTKVNMAAVMKGYAEPTHFLEPKDGKLLVLGTPMLAEFSETTKEFYPVQISPFGHMTDEFYHVLQGFIDSEQNIWLCTRNDGLYKFNPSAQLFHTIPHYNPGTGEPGLNGVLSFLQLPNGDLLASAWGEGVARYDSNLNNKPLNMIGIDETNFVTAWSMFRRKDGMVWMGLQTEGGNIMLYDEKTRKATQHKVLERNTVRRMVEDRDGNMWIGTQHKAVFKWTASKASKNFTDGFSRYDSIANCLVEDLMIDTDGSLWIATLSEGLYKINPSTGKILLRLGDSTLPKLPINGAGPLLRYNDSLLLIGSNGLCIYNTKRNTMSYMTTRDGLPSSYVVSIMKDDAGFVWMGLLNGLCRLDIFKKTFTYYDREDGMTNDHFSLTASYRLKDGRFVFGTNKDFIVFNPNNISGSKIPPDVAISEFRLSNKSLPLDSLLQLKRINLEYDNNSVLIDFAALTNLPKNKLTYYYMLEGVDKDWVKADAIQRASYPYLAPGDYTFKVKAQNFDGVFSKNTTQFKISVSAPFWETWWFYSLLLLAVAIILFALDRERMNRKEEVQKMRSNIAGNLHQDINTALNNINILSEMAKLKADKEPEKSKEFIEQIHTRSHKMILAMDDMLWSIDPGNDSMDKTVLRMKEYIDTLNNRHSVDIEMVIDERVNALKLGMQFRHEAFMLFKETIHGLLKACASDCKIHVGIEKSNLIYTIEFKNSCCDLQEFRHLLEREDIMKRIAFLKAKSELQTHKENSVFELCMPV
ncbi:MAG: two-component regulator propeller domain-containing protein, partial [Chitinophagaceae bacterium]